MANVLTHLDLNKNEIRNAVVQPLAVEPTNPKLGQIYFDSTTNKVKVYNGKGWEELGKGTVIDTIAWDKVTGKPTKLSQFTNDSGFVTSNDVYTKSQVDNKITAVKTPKKDSITQSKGTGTYTVSGYITNVMVVDNTTKEEIICDLQYPNIATTNNQVTVTVSPYTNPLSVVISYI